MVPVPFFMEDNVRFTHVAVDVVQGKDMLFHIIFLATGRFLLLCVTVSVCFHAWTVFTVLSRSLFISIIFLAA